MPRPLRFGDPPQLGPFRLDSRLHETAAGIVYLGTDPQGRPVSVALLTHGAAEDAAARDRFRAAITGELPSAASGYQAPAAGTAAVVAAQPDGPAPWVATLHEEGSRGAERFLDPVMFKGAWGGRRRRGPDFQPYWTGSTTPAVHVPGQESVAGSVAGTRVGVANTDRGLIAAIITLASLLALLALMLLLLFSCEPTRPVPTPTDIPTTFETTELPTPTPTPTPTPSKTKKRSPTPGPGTSDGGPA